MTAEAGFTGTALTAGLDDVLAELADLSDRLAEITERVRALKELQREADRTIVERGGSSGSENKPPKLRWSREKWLHHPTQEVVDNGDPRVPRTIAESKKRRRTWMLIGSQANIESGYYRRDMDMATATDVEPTYAATWHPRNGPVETLARGTGGKSYWACVWHYQENHGR